MQMLLEPKEIHFVDQCESRAKCARLNVTDVRHREPTQSNDDVILFSYTFEGITYNWTLNLLTGDT